MNLDRLARAVACNMIALRARPVSRQLARLRALRAR